jgi:hypothetical protein
VLYLEYNNLHRPLYLRRLASKSNFLRPTVEGNG